MKTCYEPWAPNIAFPALWVVQPVCNSSLRGATYAVQAVRCGCAIYDARAMLCNARGATYVVQCTLRNRCGAAHVVH
eukprot:499395-Pyramimonas_sp.AAC.1